MSILKQKIVLIFCIILSISCEDSPTSVHIVNEYHYLYPYGMFDIDTYDGDAIMLHGAFNSNPIVFGKILEYKNDSNFLVCKQHYDEEKAKELLLMCIQRRYGELTTKGVVKSVELDGLSNYINNYNNDSLFLSLVPTDVKNRDEFMSVYKYYMTNNSLFSKMRMNKLNYYIFDLKCNNKYLALSKVEFDSLFTVLNIDKKIFLN